MADTEGEDNRFLALVESNQKKMTKSPSETVIAESSSDDKGNAIRREVRIGEEVATVGDLIQILGTDVNQLWDAWEAADREVQARLAELDGGNNLPGVTNDCVKDVRQSLAEDMKAFDAEAEDIIENSHEEARACEKVGLDPYDPGFPSRPLTVSVGIWQKDTWCNVRSSAAVSVGGLRDGGERTKLLPPSHARRRLVP